MGLNLKIARIKKGMKQGELCKIVGISRSTLSLLENDKIANPSKDLMIKLSKALDVPVMELFFSDEQ